MGIGSPYRHRGAGLLRAAIGTVGDTPAWWPDLADAGACRSWLAHVWERPGFAEAVAQASPSLAQRVEAICSGEAAAVKQLRRATVGAASYLLRALGRPTPFGLFAGVAPIAWASMAEAGWGTAHQPVVRADTQWLAAVIDQIEGNLQVLEHLTVVFTNLAVRRGERWWAPFGPNRVSVRDTRAVRAVRDATTMPVRVGELVDLLAESFGADRRVVSAMVADLVRQGFLITCLRAPYTVTDPLAHLLDRLSELDIGVVPGPVWRLVRDLLTVRTGIARLNQEASSRAEPGLSCAAVTARMRAISTAGRTPIATDLRLDCQVRVPEHVAAELGRAAGVLLRLTRHPAGWPAWRDFHGAFCARYGSGTLVPVADVIDPDAGLGYPAGYPGSVLPEPVDRPSVRDERLLALAWQALADSAQAKGCREIVLTDAMIDALTDGQQLDPGRIPPHVELAARIHATSVQAVDDGEYALTVAPARAGGTLTSRFTATMTGSGLEQVYRALPTGRAGALAVQLSFGPAYPHAENVCRVPAYLPHVLSLGEHRTPAPDSPDLDIAEPRLAEPDVSVIALDDVAVTATHDALHLVSLSHHRVIEPQVFHALALDKQPPPLVRFLAHLPRAYCATWTVLDWGPAGERLPYLPRIRYGRSILARARWRIPAAELPRHDVDDDVWRKELDGWLRRWSCPTTIELRDDDRSLRLDLTVPLHAAILRTHLARHDEATLVEAIPDTEHGWFDGHAHEIAVPLVRTGPPAPDPLTGRRLPVVRNTRHGQWPGEPGLRWLSLRLHTHPERHYEIISQRVPELLAQLDNEAQWWFIRYRTPQETAHLRIRIRIPVEDRRGKLMASVGEWAHGLHTDGLAGRLVFDTYWPEVGRYGTDHLLHAAEAVFVADSWAVATQLWRPPAPTVDPTVLVTAGMVDIVTGMLGVEAGMRWLRTQAAPTGQSVDRAVAVQATALAQPGALAAQPGWPADVVDAWAARADALADYHRQLTDTADDTADEAVSDVELDTVLESLLHMHHNRAVGIDPDHERVCRRLARQTAVAWHARLPGDSR